MEATAGILRGYIESWRSSPVRWLLDRVSHLTRVSHAPRSGRAAQDRWQEMFWAEGGRSVPARPSARFEQAELWQAHSPEIRRDRALPAADEPVGAVEAAPARTRMARPVVRPTARTVGVGATYARRGRRMHRQDITRYLQVNEALYSQLVPEPEVVMPTRAFSARFTLWRGREIGTPFVSGC